MKTASIIKATVAILLIATTAWASDHDDGVNDKKSQALNLTDVYLFKENTQISGGSANHLVFVMNSNPRSLSNQQYYFSTAARYDFRVTRVGTDNSKPATGSIDIIMRFEFSAPDSSKQQKITLKIYKDGVETIKTTVDGGGAIKTTSFALAATPVNNAITIGGQTLNIFAGLREDPFFFDVNAFFKFRATGSGYPAGSPSDFTAGYNVNSIVARVPIAFLQSAGQTVFDAWAIVAIPQAN